MKSKHDGERIPDYVEETREQIHRTVETKGAGGVGLHEASDDALRRGVGPTTPAMAKRPSTGESDADESFGADVSAAARKRKQG